MWNQTPKMEDVQIESYLQSSIFHFVQFGIEHCKSKIFKSRAFSRVEVALILPAWFCETTFAVLEVQEEIGGTGGGCIEQGHRQTHLRYLMQSSAILHSAENKGALRIVQICRQGKHRSEIQANCESAILSALGMRVIKHPLCRFLQKWERCQRGGNVCRLCVADSPYNQRLYKAVRDEFWQVALVLESNFPMS